MIANGTASVTTYQAFYNKIKSENSESELDCDDDEMFPSTCECRQNFIKYYESIERIKPLQKQSLELRIATVFYLGVLLGVITGCVFYFTISLIRKKCARANQKQVERQKARDHVMMTSEFIPDLFEYFNSEMLIF